MACALRCPVCRAALRRQEAQLVCPEGHSFDIARQGYVNLLPASRKRSKAPGDNLTMVGSRRRFLDSGLYEPISAAISRLARRHVVAEEPCLLDAGCGEGYHLARLRRGLADRPGGRFFGLDISKPAVRYATHRDREITWVVGSVADLPFFDATLDLILSVFAPIDLSEFARVLDPAGTLILAVPGPYHLHELRELLYEQVRPHDPEGLFAEVGKHLERVGSERVSGRLELDDARLIGDLFRMTPYFWQATPEARARVRDLDGLVTPIEVQIGVFAAARTRPRVHPSRRSSSR